MKFPESMKLSRLTLCSLALALGVTGCATTKSPAPVTERVTEVDYTARTPLADGYRDTFELAMYFYGTYTDGASTVSDHDLCATEVRRHVDDHGRAHLADAEQPRAGGDLRHDLVHVSACSNLAVE